VIGMDRAAALKRFLTLMPGRLTPATGDLRLNGAVVSIDPATGRARAIRRLELPSRHSPHLEAPDETVAAIAAFTAGLD